jgi:hypothetical protein
MLAGWLAEDAPVSMQDMLHRRIYSDTACGIAVPAQLPVELLSPQNVGANNGSKQSLSSVTNCCACP